MLTKVKIRGKLYIENLDIQMYQGIADIAENRLEKIDEELIPTFVIEEALSYFKEKEQYETCNSIKKFFLDNKKFTLSITRVEWFGEVYCK